MNPGFPLKSSLMKQLAIPLSQQAGQWLVIPRRRESSKKNNPRRGQNLGVELLCRIFFTIWIPAFAGMTDLGFNGKSGFKLKISQRLNFIFFYVILMFPATAFCAEPDWSVGVYGGQYYDSEPAGILMNGNANFLNQYLVALTASRLLWRAEALPLSLEIDSMIGQQFGLASLSEIGFAPVLRWSSFPWKEILQTDIRFGPLGVSYTSTVSPLERNKNGSGSHTLNLLLIEFDFSLPREKSKEVFVRLHHRCAIYDLLNNYGVNGEDFLTLGYRRYF
jgi:hypothetical protein